MKLQLSPIGIIVSVIVAAGAITGLVLSGSPAKERMRKYDAERIRDLENIRYSIAEVFYRREGRLPNDLTEGLTVASANTSYLQDPETGERYVYSMLDDSSYQLCASFSLSSDEQNYQVNPIWEHGPGWNCFQFDAPTVAEDQQLKFAPAPLYRD